MYMSVCLSVCKSMPMEARRLLDPLQLMAVSGHVSVGYRTWVSCKSNKCSWLLSHVSSPDMLYYYALCPNSGGNAVTQF